MVLAVGFYNLVRREEDPSRWTALTLGRAVDPVLLVCLVLTKSRSAYLGLLAGVGIVAWQSRRQVSRRLLLGTGLAGLLLVAALVAAGLATRQLDRQVLTQSLDVDAAIDWNTGREPGVSSPGVGRPRGSPGSSMFWSGVGPGNFRACYLRYKLPESSEEILDPHNLFLEVWATGGFGAFSPCWRR